LRTTDLAEASILRVDVPASEHNGLSTHAQIMHDEIVTVRRGNLDQRTGLVETGILLAVERALLVFLGIAR
jgi:mRNA interferase MazF